MKREFFGLKFNVSCLKFQKGQMMIIGLIFLMVVLILSAALFARVAGFLRFGSNSILREQATNLAEAGVDYAIWQLNETAGSYNPQPPDDEFAVGTTGVFKIAIADKSANLKTITATGYVTNSTTPKAKRTVKVDVAISSDTIAFRYAVQSGNGGIDMSQSSTITSSNGTATVYSNGNITAGNGTHQTIDGDAYSVGTIESPPITITGSPYPSASPKPLPDIEDKITEAKSQAEASSVVNCFTTPSECNISGGTKSIGPQKYINGDLTISNQAVVTINGPIWVTENLVVKNGGTQVNLNENFGSLGTYFIVDKTIKVEQGGAFNPTSASPKGYILVVSNSTSANALTISQSGANALFYALNGGAQLSQTAQVNSLTANSLTMSQSAILTYDTGLASAQFATGPGGTWQIKRGTYRFTNNP